MSAGGVWLSADASARLAGRMVAVELDLHRRLGKAAGEVDDVRVQRYLAGAAMAHAWRAALWEVLLPVSVGLPSRAELVVLDEAAGPEVPMVVAGRSDAGALLGALLDEVYAPLLTGYDQLANDADAASGGPATLAARRSADDLRRAVAEGRRLSTQLRAAGAPFGD